MQFSDEYAALETEVLAFMDAPEAAAFDALACRVFAFQTRRNPLLKAFAEISNASAPRHWRAIPPLPQSAFKDATVRCFPETEIARTFFTSGTTGEARGRHDFYSLKLQKHSVLAGWKRLGRAEHRRVILAPSPEDAPHSSLSYMLGLLSQDASDFYVDAEGTLDVERLQSALEETRPVALLGTALAFLHFFEHPARRKTWRLPQGSYAMETGGYKGSGRALEKRDLLVMFHDIFGLPESDVINEYGMTELSSQFYSSGLGQPHVAPPWMRTQLLDPETNVEAAEGDIGRIAVYDLANLGSALAIQTQDLAIRQGEDFILLGRDPSALPRGCSRAADELLSR